MSGLIIVSGIASQWTAAGGGDTSGTIRPTSNVSITPSGMQGGFGDIDDDPDSPDGNWLLRPSSQDQTLTDCTFGMGAPSGTPGGTDAQELKVQLRCRDRDGGTGNSSTAVFDVLVDGTAIASSQNQGATATTVHTFTFDDSVSSDWSTLECRIQQTSHGGGSPSARSFIEIGALEVNWSAT